MRAKRDRVPLRQILESALLISRWLEGVEKDRFLKDELLQEAVIRRLEVIGEAAKNVSPELKDRHPEVPWKEISAKPRKPRKATQGVTVPACPPPGPAGRRCTG